MTRPLTICVFWISAPVTNPPVTPKALAAGQKRTHPTYIPSHFPEFPDPHTYIKTPVSLSVFLKKQTLEYHQLPSIHSFKGDKLGWWNCRQKILQAGCVTCLLFCSQTFREPVSDYQVVREKAASQRRDVERALTRFMAKTGETQSLFKDDITAFPCECLHFKHLSGVYEDTLDVCEHNSVIVSSVIAARPSSIPYLSALLPSELELQALEETDSSEQDDQTDSENAAGNIIAVSRHSWNWKGFCIITSAHLHLCFHQSFRTILEPTKRTPCFLPAALFLPQRPARTTWLTTRTSGRSRNPKSGGRNKGDGSHLK